MALSGWSFIIQPTNDLFLVGGLAGWTKAPRFSGRLVINDDFICRLLVYVRNRECQYTISVMTRATFQRLSSHRHLNLSQHSLLYPNGYRSPSSQSVASVASTSPQTHALHCSTIVFSSWATHSDKLIMSSLYSIVCLYGSSLLITSSKQDVVLLQCENEAALGITA